MNKKKIPMSFRLDSEKVSALKKMNVDVAKLIRMTLDKFLDDKTCPVCNSQKESQTSSEELL